MSKKIVLVSATPFERYNEWEINGIPIFETGIGKINAAARMVEIIINSGCDTVVNFGSCGNLKHHDVGKVMKVGKVINDYETYGFGNVEREIVLDEESQIKLFTTDSFYQPYENYSTWYNLNINKCDVVDMEGFALAKVCKDFGVEFHSYKWVSDNGDISIWKENAAKGYENFKKRFVQDFLENN
jgi:adenosylhomocysteine nucleosidase